MKSIITAIVFVSILIGSVYGQQGKYERKSISAVMPVYLSPNISNESEFDKTFFEKMVKFYLEVKRFDYNILSTETTKEFQKELKSVTEFSPAKISEIMERTVVKEIIDILNDSEVKKIRGLANKSEADFETFAATKGKSLNITTEEFKVLLNSAYIYLPFVSSLSKEVDKNQNISVKIEGGILWYQIVTDDNGKTNLLEIVAATTKGLGSAKRGEKYDFRFGSNVKKVDADKYAQYNAIQAWTKNLGVKTKKIEDFLLTAQILESDGNNYAVAIGNKEGVHLDDGYDLVEYVEDEEGNKTTDRIGFVRVSKTGDNDSSATNYTFVEQYFGRNTNVGSIIMERPRLGIDVRVKFGYLTGLNIPKEDTYIGLAGGNILNEDATSATATNVIFAYNLAPIVGISQTFYDLDIGFAIPLATINPDADAFTYILSLYTGVSKKLFFGRTNITAGLGFGYDMFSMSGKFLETDYTYSLSSLGIKADVGFEYMWNADLSINVGVGYKFGLSPMNATLEWDGNELFSYTGVEVMDLYPDLNLGNLSINIGANYALSELPFNLFGFLDPLKKH